MAEEKYLSLKEIVERHGIRLKKRLGQNLLLDLNMNDRIVEAARIGPDDDVVEVGAGLGSLTARAARRADRVLAIEIDSSFEPVLTERFAAATNIHVLIADVLVHSLDELVAAHLPDAGNLKLIGNLPFNPAAHIIMQCLEADSFFSTLVVMVQKEVADRLVAEPGTHDYSRITVAAQFYADVEVVQIVPRTVFAPRPRVDAAIVRFVCHETIPLGGTEREMFSKAVQAAFGKRRKMLKNALAVLERSDVPAGGTLRALESADIDPARRGETLAVDEFVALARALCSETGEESVFPST